MNAIGRTATGIRLFSIEEVREIFSVSRPTINRMISAGILRTVRIGRAVRIPEAALVELIDAGGKRNIPAPGTNPAKQIRR
jgi:excisionase family DNA binding protein